MCFLGIDFGVPRGPNPIDLFAHHAFDDLKHRFLDGAWSAWKSL